MPHTVLLTRIRGEYLEMPGLRLTFPQAQRLWGLERTDCKRVLDALVEAKFLCVNPDGTYARASDGRDIPRPQPLRADHGAGTRRLIAS